MSRGMKICVITGAAMGIGLHLCRGFAEKGYQVVGLDVEEKNALPPGARLIRTDLRREEEILAAFESIGRDYGGADVLINNAGVSRFEKPITQLTADEWDRVLDTNLRGMMLCSREFIKLNEGREYGRIINMASTRWMQNEENWEAYGASKGGVVSLTAAMAVSLHDRPITVNAISPGWICTEGYENLTAEDHSQIPSGRVGFPRDILNACLFLADAENDFVNGIDLVVDGGMVRRMIWR